MGRQLAWIPTPYSVYAAAYDAAGRLWFGGGFWYGSGFMGCAERDGTVRWYAGGDGWSRDAPPSGLQKPEPTWGPVTVSGLWVTPDGNHVVLSLWSAGLNPQPTRILALDDVGPRPAYDRSIATEVAEAATGVIVHRGYLWVRQLGREPDRVLIGVPSNRLDRPGGPSPVLASRRLVGIDGAAVTGWGRGLLLRESGTASPHVIAGVPEVGRHPQWGAGVRDRRHGDDVVDDRSTLVLGIRDGISGNASAITANEAGTRITAGFADGAVARWSVKPDDDHPSLMLDDIRPAHRFPIAAACQLPSGDEVTADRGGWVHRWRDGRLVSEWRLETAHSPRTLAADPTTGQIAVGCKGGRGGPTSGGIAIVQL